VFLIARVFLRLSIRKLGVTPDLGTEVEIFLKKRRLESMSGLCFDGVAAISAVAVTLGFVRRFALGRFCGVSGLGKAVAEPPHSKSSRRSGDR